MISEERREDWRWGLVWAALAVVTLLALHRLRDFPVQPRFSDAWHGVSQVFPATAWAAVKVWSFWLIASSVLGGIALRLDNEIDPSDALLIGAGGAWAVADVLGFTLGPIGLFNGITIWGLLLVGGAWLWRNPPRIRFSPPTPGQTLAIVAVALLAVSYFALQLASPVPPFMDVLSYPASVQRILTFGVYLPFDNDPYGCWGPWAQTPGLELFYAMIGASTRTIAVLAETAAMLPMAALMIFASYRLGKALFNDTVGGIAGLLLFFTCLFRRAQGMRGTAVDFALLALGLAFFLDRSRRRVFLGAGAAMLGAAFLSHAIDGGLAMIVAGAGVVMWLVEGDLRRFIAGVFALAGATLLTLPEFAIALAHPVPSAFLAATVIAGFLVIAGAAWMLKPTSKTLNDTRLSVMNVALLALFVFAALYRHATQGYSIYAKVADDLPFLFLLCFIGLVISIQFSTDRPMLMRYTGLVAVALLLGVAGEYLDPIMRALSHTKSQTMMAGDIGTKLWDYWCPYWLTIPAALPIALAYDRWSRPFTFLILLTILIYPWYQIKDPVDYDSVQHSITEHWAFNLNTAADGYWAGHADRRWTFAEPEMGMINVLEQERAAGRITTATHVLHLTDDISSWSLVQFPILTGIDDDPIEFRHDPGNLWEGGSRVRGLDDLPAALAARPPYILEQTAPPPGMQDPPPNYDRIYDAAWLRLYRRHDLATVNSPPPPERLWRGGLGIALALLASLMLAPRREREEQARPSAALEHREQSEHPS